MKPTMKLRWRREPSSTSDDPQVMNGYDERLVLQQWWEGWPENVLLNDRHAKPPGEWRDIPVEVKE